MLILSVEQQTIARTVVSLLRSCRNASANSFGTSDSITPTGRMSAFFQAGAAACNPRSYGRQNASSRLSTGLPTTARSVTSLERSKRNSIYISGGRGDAVVSIGYTLALLQVGAELVRR